MLLSVDERLGRARTVLERRGEAPAELLSPEIAASWTRCLTAGLDPRRPPSHTMVDEATLRATRERHDLTRRLALAEMHNLYHQIAGSNYMIAFAAPGGILLDTIADASFRATANRTSICPGTLWTEGQCGTNALGTAAETVRAVTVHGPEHFFTRLGSLTCTAAPVFAPDATLAGVLDASSEYRTRQQHTQALVAMAATQIENGLFREYHRASLILAFHSRGEYLHTLSAGLLALDAEGVVLGANTQARFLLHGLPARPGRRFEELFRLRFSTFLDDAAGQERLRLEDKVGSTFIGRIETLRRPRAVPVCRSTPTPLRGPEPGGEFVAEDPALRAALAKVEGAVGRRLPILIRGATGTGKEVMARHAHALSCRRGAFVAVNCAALPAHLVEAELFGHVDGAFTGARRGGAPGLIVEADGGTLLLDEIGDMPLALQAVLLRLLDDWTVRPVGGTKPRRVDVQLVAASNAGLAEAVAVGRFRRDLYYRLNTVEIMLPGLAERQDFAAIACHLLRGIAPERRLGPASLARLAAHEWPGNIRELRSVLSRLALTAAEPEIGPEAVDAALGPDSTLPATGASAPLREAVLGRIRSAHREAGGNISAAARRLGVSRNTIYRALRRLS
jgi:sigma-54 dependent transcriptional regulator, acetoin dehydrogenase operon transcriptional activator AcoR